MSIRLAVALMLIISTCHSTTSSAQEASKGPQGSWSQIALISDPNGSKIPLPTGGRIEFRGERVFFRSIMYFCAEGKSLEGKIVKIDATKTRATIELFFPQWGCGKPLTLSGVFAVDGNRLRLCVTNYQRWRPTNFEYGPDASAVTYELAKAEPFCGSDSLQRFGTIRGVPILFGTEFAQGYVNKFLKESQRLLLRFWARVRMYRAWRANQPARSVTATSSV